MIGLLLSVAAVAVVLFAIRTYAGPVPPMVFPCAAAFAVFVVMNRRLWQTSKESYEAGEVGRRVNKSNMADPVGATNCSRSHWFANGPDNTSAKKTLPTEERKKKALQAVGPEGLV